MSLATKSELLATGDSREKFIWNGRYGEVVTTYLMG